MPNYFTYVDRNNEYFLSHNNEIIPDAEVERLVSTGDVKVCISCAVIGYAPDFTSFQHNNEEISYCCQCAEEYCRRCTMCSSFGSTSINLSQYDIPNGHTDIICASCYQANYARCHSCGMNESRSTIIEHEGRFWCNNCSEEKFPKCKYCSNRHLGKRICRCGTEQPTGFLTNRYFSIEIEVIDPEGESSTAWKAIHDGSLSSGGREYISGPIVGEAAINEIYRECSKIGGYIDQSCGFHLHLDFGTETPDSVARFGAACQVLEPFAFSVVTRNRDNSKYCRKYDNEVIKRLEKLPLDVAIYNTSNSSELSKCKTQKYHSSRYHWFNMHSFFFRGTVEIRHHHGTKDPNSILKWAEFWLKVADWSRDKEFNDILKKTPEQIIAECGVREDTKEYLGHKKLIYIK